MKLMIDATNAVARAEYHAYKSDSARIRADDAAELLRRSQYRYAILAARDSLAHSVGVSHADWLEVRDLWLGAK